MSTVHGFTPEDELPELDGKVYEALFNASRLGPDDEGGCRVFPWVEIDGLRYHLVVLPAWQCEYCGVPRFVEHDPNCENA